MKRFFYFLSIIGAHLLVLISCEKTPVPEYRDELLSQVSGKYQLVEFLWEGDPIDINNDGEKTCDLLKEFRQWGGFEDNWYLYSSTKNALDYQGRVYARLPIVQETRPGKLWSSGCSIFTTYIIDNQGVHFKNKDIQIAKPEYEFEKVCPFEMDSLHIEFLNSSSEESSHYLVSGKAKIYDNSTASIKEGIIHLDYIFLYKSDI